MGADHESHNTPAHERDGERLRPPQRDGGHGPAVGVTSLLHLQRAVGNRAVSRLVAVQRDPDDDDENPLADVSDPIANAIQRRDRALVTRLESLERATDAQRFDLLSILLPGPFDDDAKEAAQRIWQSFGEARLPRIAADHSTLWDQCKAAGAELPDSWLGAGAGHREVSAQEQVGANVFVVQGAYDYRVSADAITIRVGMNFQPDDGVTVPTATWFGYITNTWNTFKAVNQDDRTQEKRIDFQPMVGNHHTIQVSAGNGRANAAHYYLGDTRAQQTIPHEFGHLIGLEDEYERDAADYERITETRVSTATGANSEEIARKLHDALSLPERVFEWHTTTVRRRQQAVQAVLDEYHIVANYQTGRSALTHEVAAKYRELYGHEISYDVMDRIYTRWGRDTEAIRDWRERVTGTFQYTSTSIMGDMSDHTHPVEARHVRSFAQLPQGVYGGSWRPEPR